MIIYYGGGGGGGIAWPRRFQEGEIEPFSVLVSYYGISKSWKRPWFVSEVMLDSGAFSAWKKRIEINVNDYLRFCKEGHFDPKVIVNLDIIGDAEASWDNYCRLRDAGLEVLPVFHLSSDFRWLHRYVENTDYIGLGDVATVYKTRRLRLLDRVFTDYPDPLEIGFHGFGVADADLLRRYPWRSIDATTPYIEAVNRAVRTRFGQVRLMPERTHAPRARYRIDRTLKELERLGFDSTLVLRSDREGLNERVKANMRWIESINVPDRFNHSQDYLL